MLVARVSFTTIDVLLEPTFRPTRRFTARGRKWADEYVRFVIGTAHSGKTRGKNLSESFQQGGRCKSSKVCVDRFMCNKILGVN
jgi:hypothetical protein